MISNGNDLITSSEKKVVCENSKEPQEKSVCPSVEERPKSVCPSVEERPKISITDEDRALNYLFLGEELFVKERLVEFGSTAPYWSSVLTRVASLKKPMATVLLSGKLEHSWKKTLLPMATSLRVSVIGPYPDHATNFPTISLVSEDLLKSGVLLGDLASKEELDFFGHDQDPILATPLEAYIHGADISRGNNLLECALVFGYPLDRAREVL